MILENEKFREDSHKQYDIVFYAEGMPFNGDTYKTEALGGSETAVCFMANYLARLGHKVRVYSICDKQGIYDGVLYQHVNAFNEFVNCGDKADFLISSRTLAPFKATHIPSVFNILWAHDIIVPDYAAEVNGLIFRLDKIFVNSEFHKEQWKKYIPNESPEDLFFVTKNGFDASLIHKAIPKDKHKNQVFYSSRPERGLLNLLELWPEIKKRHPELILKLARYGFKQIDERIKPIIDKINELIGQLPDIEFLGNLSKEDLYRAMGKSKLVLYPTEFPEISCITAIEAQALGIPMIASKFCALKETIQDCKTGVLVPGNPKSNEYKARFLNEIDELLTNETKWNILSKNAREYAEFKYRYNIIAAEWCRLFDSMIDNISLDRIVSELYENSEHAILQEYFPEVSIQDAVKNIFNNKLKEQYEFGADCFISDTNFDLHFEAITIHNFRYKFIIDQIKKSIDTTKPFKVLDIGSGAGHFSIGIGNEFEKANILGIDISQKLTDLANQEKKKRCKYSNVKFGQVDFINANESSILYDVIICAEVLEHIPDLYGFLEKIRLYCHENTLLLFTVPLGKWEIISKEKPGYDENNEIFHIRTFHRSDLIEIFGTQKDFQLFTSAISQHPKYDVFGHFLFSFKGNQEKFGEFNKYRHLRYRPRQTVSVCMLVGGANVTNGLLKCLRSIDIVSDEIIAGITDGCPQEAIEQLNFFDNNRNKIKKINIPSINHENGGFEAARNKSIEPASCDWILWIDTDEYLLNPEKLSKYLRDNLFVSYAMKQIHHAIDVQMEPDLPNRLFRNHLGIRFYGIIHEHPEHSINRGLNPAILLGDTFIYHDGYVTENIRRERFRRNLPFLMADRQKYPDRKLGRIFEQRDLYQLGLYEIEKNGGQITPKAEQMIHSSIAIYKKYFEGTRNENWGLFNHTFKLYQSALKRLALGNEIAIHLGYLPGSKQTFNIPQLVILPSDVEVIRFLDREEIDDYLKVTLDRMLNKEEQIFEFDKE